MRETLRFYERFSEKSSFYWIFANIAGMLSGFPYVTEDVDLGSFVFKAFDLTFSDRCDRSLAFDSLRSVFFLLFLRAHRGDIHESDLLFPVLRGHRWKFTECESFLPILRCHVYGWSVSRSFGDRLLFLRIILRKFLIFHNYKRLVCRVVSGTIERVRVVGYEVWEKSLYIVSVFLSGVAFHLRDSDTSLARPLFLCECVFFGVFGDFPLSLEEITGPLYGDAPLSAFLFLPFLVGDPVKQAEALEVAEIRIVGRGEIRDRFLVDNMSPFFHAMGKDLLEDLDMMRGKIDPINRPGSTAPGAFIFCDVSLLLDDCRRLAGIEGLPARF